MILLRSLIYAIWLYLAMTLVGLIWLPVSLVSRKSTLGAGRAWTRLAVWGLRWIVGARVQFKGLEYAPKTAAIVAMKHQSMLDTLVPFILLDDPAFILKRELVDAPVFGYYTKAMGMIPIDREAHASALKALLRAARPVRDAGRQIVIFPEGTRQELGVRGDYKPGVAALYKDLGVPCVPAALDTGKIWSAHGLIRRPGVATIEFLPPIPPGLPREEFMRTLVERIETRSQELLESKP